MATRLFRIFQLTALAGAMLAAGTATAAPGHSKHASARHQDRSGEAYYAWVNVLDVDPIVRTRYIEEPVERCYDTRGSQRHDDRYRNDRARHDDRGYHDDRGRYEHRDSRGQASPGAVLLGGALGGLIGNQFGGGNGKKALTVAGAVIGASIGASASSGNHSRSYGSRGYDSRDDRWRSEPVRRCEVSYESRPVERIEGYEVTYRYHGRRFTKVVDEHPGSRMRVRVDVQPIV